jgi:peptidoglycan hydrolase CwlO-like protein
MKSTHEIKNKIERKRKQLLYTDAKRKVLKHKCSKLKDEISYLKSKLEKNNNEFDRKYLNKEGVCEWLR